MRQYWDRCFRFRRRILYVGVACTAFFVLAAVGSPVIALWNVDGSFARPELAALVFGAFWSCWAGLGAWLILAYIRSRLNIDARSVQEVGCLRSRTIRLDELLWARWRLVPKGGSLVLRDRDGKLTVAFDRFASEDQRELIQFFRSRIGEHIQEGWERFEARFVTWR